MRSTAIRWNLREYHFRFTLQESRSSLHCETNELAQKSKFGLFCLVQVTCRRTANAATPNPSEQRFAHDTVPVRWTVLGVAFFKSREKVSN
jgi:hypothetical protein